MKNNQNQTQEKLNKITSKLKHLTNEIYDVLKEVPKKGDTSTDCQRLAFW